METSRIDISQQLASNIRRMAVAGVEDIVPGPVSVVITVDLRVLDIEALSAVIAKRPMVNSTTWTQGRTHEFDCEFDGPDLPEVAKDSGLSPNEMIDLLSSSTYVVAFLGFSPGFAYMEGLDKRIKSTRLASPRLSVPARSIAIAGSYIAVYPHSTPGGWRLLGSCEASFFDPNRDPPNTLSPGDKVTFRPRGRSTRDAISHDQKLQDDGLAIDRETNPSGSGEIEVLRNTGLSTIQDRGRAGYAHLGVPRAGAVDPWSFQQANAIVGNDPNSATIELSLSSISIKLEGRGHFSVCGADPLLKLDGLQVPTHQAVPYHNGQVLESRPGTFGVRSYLAVRGGLLSPRVLSSRSADTLSGLDSRNLSVGDRLAIGIANSPPRDRAIPPQPPSTQPAYRRVRIVLGPRAVESFDDMALEAFLNQTWSVSSHSDRTGVRLIGSGERPHALEALPSEGVVLGAIQIPPNGEPIVLLSNHGTMGGYPVIAVVLLADIDLISQSRPGDELALEVVSIDLARQITLERYRQNSASVQGYRPVEEL